MKQASWTCALVGAGLVLLAGCGGSVDNGASSGTTPAAGAAASAPAVYTIGGGISGLTTQGLILLNGTDTLSPNSGDTSFTFPTAVPAGTAYSVTVQLQPDAITCTVANGSGKVGTANVTDVEVSCASAAFTVGGSISGLTGNGLVLANGSDRTSPAPGATTFTFPTALQSAASFNVTVVAQPSGQTCVVLNGTGVILTSSVSNVGVTCH